MSEAKSYHTKRPFDSNLHEDAITIGELLYGLGSIRMSMNLSADGYIIALVRELFAAALIEIEARDKVTVGPEAITPEQLESIKLTICSILDEQMEWSAVSREIVDREAK